MTIYANSADFQPSRYTAVTYDGLGIKASNIPTTGTDGAGYLFNDVTLPTDNDVEVRGDLTTIPSEGSFTSFEDGSMIVLGLSDGVHIAQYTLYADNVALGSAIIRFVVGEVAGDETTGVVRSPVRLSTRHYIRSNIR